MTLENMLQKKLGNEPYYDIDHPEGTPPNEVQHQGWRVLFNPKTTDALSASLMDVTLRREDGPGDGDVRAWAGRVAAKTTGLLEPLKVVEIDTGKHIALLRSAEPATSDPGVQYYEIELHGTSQAAVRRFRGFHEAARKREQVPFALTYEVLARLIAGITA